MAVTETTTTAVVITVAVTEATTYGASYCPYRNGYNGGGSYGSLGLSTCKPYHQYIPIKNYNTGQLYGPPPTSYYKPFYAETGYAQFGSSHDFYYYQHVFCNDGKTLFIAFLIDYLEIIIISCKNDLVLKFKFYTEFGCFCFVFSFQNALLENS